MKKRIAILGSTGSIGTQTLDVIKHHPEQFEVAALAAGSNIDLLESQIFTFKPKLVSVATKELADRLAARIGFGTRVVYGDEGILEAAAHHEADVVVTAMVGSQGLRPTLAAIESGKHIGLANKETLVSAGHIVTEKARKHQVDLIPVDSEHSAIFQCLNGEKREQIRKLIVTASGGSFRDRSRDELKDVTVEDALKHPNWSMGAKITIDSATLVNKGLEVIEAHWLFGIPYEQIEVVIHPESIIHSMVEFQDHSIMAQLGNPDMRVPIQYALTYPNRLPSPSAPLQFGQLRSLNFKSVDYDRFPCLRWAIECGKQGGTATTVFNAANEAAVGLFLDRRISFLEIESYIEQAITEHHSIPNPSLEEIAEADRWARASVLKWSQA
ncbi:1-deoxy-D-xylulose-5-phosphate reductoisomerase [Marinicrinis lubricantis]|uniref:1-deoxy-D-xylulose 5-phosphate reductoisomerase n=1 Tax=Marinicrinis lubricantis TaxID=2086470 RepID=A0ABW1IMH0_9BACL